VPRRKGLLGGLLGVMVCAVMARLVLGRFVARGKRG